MITPKNAVNTTSAPVIFHVLLRSGQRTKVSSCQLPLRYSAIRVPIRRFSVGSVATFSALPLIAWLIESAFSRFTPLSFALMRVTFASLEDFATFPYLLSIKNSLLRQTVKYSVDHSLYKVNLGEPRQERLGRSCRGRAYLGGSDSVMWRPDCLRLASTAPCTRVLCQQCGILLHTVIILHNRRLPIGVAKKTPGRYRLGIVKLNVLPWFRRLSSSIVVPIRWPSLRATYRPSPVPFVSRVR